MPNRQDPEQIAVVKPPQCFAVIPAAGHSRRMGSRHKLLLPWGDTTVIDRVLDVWFASRIDRVILVSRPDDRALHDLLRRRTDVELVVPDVAPADMKRSVRIGLDHLAASNPVALDRWLIAPADMPTLRSDLINRVIDESREIEAIVVPRFGQRRGHPVSFPWSLAEQMDRLGADEGINRLLDWNPLHWLELAAEQFPDDLDTEDDYQRLRRASDCDRAE